MTSDTKSPSPEFTGVRIRTIESTDNEAVRTLFAATQAELFGNVESPELRQGVKDWVERILATDLERPSHYYSQPRKNFWIAEAADGEIAATIAIDTTADTDVAELFRMLVSHSHRRKGLGRLMVQTAEQWTTQQGYRKLKLTTTERHIEAMALYRSMGFEHIHTTDMGFLKTLDFEKKLEVFMTPPANPVQQKLISRSTMSELLIDLEMEPGARWRVEVKLPGEWPGEAWDWLPSSAQSSESGLALLSAEVPPATMTPRMALAPPTPALAPGVFNDFAPISAMLDQPWTIAIILLRLGHYSFGIAEDEKLVVHKSGGRYVKNRQRKGGQSAARFTRNREKWIQQLFDEVAEVTLSRVKDYGKHIDWLAFGGDRAVLNQFAKRLSLPDGLTDRVMPWRVPVEQPGIDELERAVTSAWSWRVWDAPGDAG